MSQENVEAIRRSVDHFNETGVPAWDLMDPLITFTTRGDVEGPTTYVGIDGFKQALGVFSAVWSQIRWEIEDITGTDDAYVIDLLFHLQAAASGVPIQVKEAWAVWMEDGKYLRIEQYGSRSEALEAAGLSE